MLFLVSLYVSITSFPSCSFFWGYRNKKRVLQRSNPWIVVRLRFQQVAIEHVNEKRKGGTKKGRRSWKPKDVAPEGACWVKFSIRALKARGARINTRWQGNGREGAPRIQIPCSLSLSRNYRPSKVALPVLPRHFSRATGGAHTKFHVSCVILLPKILPFRLLVVRALPPLPTALLEGALNYVRNKQHRMLPTNSRASSQYILGVTKRFPWLNRARVLADFQDFVSCFEFRAFVNR